MQPKKIFLFSVFELSAFISHFKLVGLSLHIQADFEWLHSVWYHHFCHRRLIKKCGWWFSTCAIANSIKSKWKLILGLNGPVFSFRNFGKYKFWIFIISDPSDTFPCFLSQFAGKMQERTITGFSPKFRFLKSSDTRNFLSSDS